MRWLAPISKRVANLTDVDQVLRNLDERVRQIVKHMSRPEDDYHGDKTLILPWGGMACESDGTGITTLEVDINFDYERRGQATGIGNIFPIPIPLHAGDRIKSVLFRYLGASTATKRFSLTGGVPFGSGVHSVHETTTTAVSGHAFVSITATPQLLVESNTVFFAQFRSGAANDRFYSAEVTYDRPRTKS